MPVHYVDLSNIDYQELRKQFSDSLNPRMASYYKMRRPRLANTYDDPDAAALAELAARYAHPGSKRVMELPNLHPPSTVCRGRVYRPSHFAASQTETDKPHRDDLPRIHWNALAAIFEAEGRVCGRARWALSIRTVAGSIHSNRGACTSASSRSRSRRWRTHTTPAGRWRNKRSTRALQRAPFPGMPRDDRPYVKFVIYG